MRSLAKFIAPPWLVVISNFLREKLVPNSLLTVLRRAEKKFLYSLARDE